MKTQYIIREYDNGAQEILDTVRCHRKIIYHNDNKRNPFNDGDTVWFVDGIVVAVCPTGGDKRIYDPLYSVLPLDHVKFPVMGSHTQTYFDKQEVQLALRKDHHFYDEYMSFLMRCTKCNGSGKLSSNTDGYLQSVDAWEAEGGPPGKDPIIDLVCDKCEGKSPIVNEDVVRASFQLPKTEKSGFKEMKDTVLKMIKQKETTK